MYAQSSILIGSCAYAWVENTSIFCWVKSVIGFALETSSISPELLTVELINKTRWSCIIKDGIFHTIWAEIKLSRLQASIVHFNAAIVQKTERRSAPGADESVLILYAVGYGAGDALPGTGQLKIVSTGDAKGFRFDALVASCEAVSG